MPYSGSSDPDLPDYVAELGEGDRAQWVAVFNSAYSACITDGGRAGDCESSAFAQANGVVLKKEKGRMKLSELWDKIKALFEGAMAESGEGEPEEEPGEERAIGLSQVWEQVFTDLSIMDTQAGTWSWPVDIFEDGGSLYLVVAREGKLYRVPLVIDSTTVTMGDWQEVETQHTPVAGPEMRTAVLRQADGRYRWLSISATAALDRVGEIDSRDLFDRFIERAATEGYPQRDFYHLEDAAPVGQSDTLLRDGNCLITSGLYYDTPLAQAVRRATEAGVLAGDSISYYPAGDVELAEVAPGVRIPVYRDGTLKWIASLPEKEAASLFTATTVREVRRMEQRVREALEKLKEFGLTDSDVAGIVDRVDETNRAIDEHGIITREVTPTPDPEPVPVAPPAPVSQAPVEVTLDDKALAAVARAAVQAPEMQALAGQLAALEQAVTELRATIEAQVSRAVAADNALQAQAERLAALEQEDDAKRREWLADLPAGRATTINVTYRPRQAHADPEGEDSGLDNEAIAAAAAAKRPKK